MLVVHVIVVEDGTVSCLLCRLKKINTNVWVECLECLGPPADGRAASEGSPRVVPAYARRVERERGSVPGRGGGH